jgi:uncharacterized protein YjbI with pentapeptide repeats
MANAARAHGESKLVECFLRRRALKVAAIFAIAFLASPAPALAQARDFKDKDLSDRKYDNAQLDGSDFTGATLRNASFYRASLKGAKFVDADLRQCVLQKADLTGADFTGAVMPFIALESNMTKAKLEEVDLKQASTYGVNFQGANLRNTKGWEEIANANFQDADLRGANFGGVRKFNPKPDQFKGALYDAKTRWPSWIDEEMLGAKKVN